MQLFAINTVKSKTLEQGDLVIVEQTLAVNTACSKTFTVPANTRWILKGVSFFCTQALTSSTFRYTIGGVTFDTTVTAIGGLAWAYLGTQNIILPAGAAVTMISSCAVNGNFTDDLMYTAVSDIQ